MMTLICLLLPQSLFAAEYYVSPSGSDVNVGSQTSPWKSITKVNSAAYLPGDTILFQRGGTWNMNSNGEAGALVIKSNGTATNSITFGAYGVGNPPIFNGTNMIDSGYMWKGMIVFENASYITLENLDLAYAIKQQIGIGAQGLNSHHLKIQNNIVRSNRTDGYMLMYIENKSTPGLVNNILVTGNTFFDSRWNAIRVTGGVTKLIISNNKIYKTVHNGIDSYPSNNTNNTYIDIYGNEIYDFARSASGAGIYLPGVSNVNVYDNSIHDAFNSTNDTYGVKVGSVVGYVMDNVKVFNNRIWNINTNNANTYGLWFNNCTNCSAYNNTLFSNTNTLLNSTNISLVLKNNLAYKNTYDQTSLKNYTLDPKFVNAPIDLHLQPGSPACTAGEGGTYVGAYPCSTTPTVAPTAKPTVAPTAKPTIAPTAKPTVTPTAKPTAVPTVKPTIIPTPTPIINQIKAEYFNNKTLSGTPVVTKIDSSINFDWGSNSPGTGINKDLFSVRWTKIEKFSGGSYKFTIRADDGVRIYLDNTLIYNKWVNQSASTKYITKDISAGNHTIKVEYYENTGLAVAKISWVKI